MLSPAGASALPPPSPGRAEARGGFPAPAIVHDVLRSPGRPLDIQTRAYFEPRFGHDFGEVRVHTEERASRAATAINADAFTSGKSVVFGKNKYAPRTADGLHLLAHELAHVVQQRRCSAGIQRKIAANNGKEITIDLKKVKPGDEIVPVFPDGVTTGEKKDVAKIVNAMAKTPSGLAALQRWIDLPEAVKLDYTDQKLFDAEGFVEHGHSTRDEKNKTVKVKISGAQANVLSDRYRPLEKGDQFIGAVATHESAHQADDNVKMQSRQTALDKQIKKGDPAGEKAAEMKNLTHQAEIEPVRQELKTLIEYDLLYPDKKGKWRKGSFRDFLTADVYNATVREAVMGLIDKGYIKPEHKDEILANYIHR